MNCTARPCLKKKTNQTKKYRARHGGTCNPVLEKLRQGGLSQVQDQPELHSKCQAMQDYRVRLSHGRNDLRVAWSLGVCGKAHATELLLQCVPPGHLQQAAHVPQSHLRSPPGEHGPIATGSFTGGAARIPGHRSCVSQARGPSSASLLLVSCPQPAQLCHSELGFLHLLTCSYFCSF